LDRRLDARPGGVVTICLRGNRVTGDGRSSTDPVTPVSGQAAKGRSVKRAHQRR